MHHHMEKGDEEIWRRQRRCMITLRTHGKLHACVNAAVSTLAQQQQAVSVPCFHCGDLHGSDH